MTVFTRARSLFSFAALILFSAACLAASAPAQAQAGSRVAKSTGLDLDAAQRAKADARQARFQKDITALRTDPKLTDPEKQARGMAMYQAMDKDMLAILTPAQRAQVMQQRQINGQFRKDVLALQADKSLTDAQKKARYVALVQKARNESLALMPPDQRAEALKRTAATEQVVRLNQQLQTSETPAQSQKLKEIALSAKASMQSVIADKTLSADAKTAKIVSLRKDALRRDLALLTPSQRTLYSRIQAIVSSSR